MNYIWIIEVKYARSRAYDALGNRFYFTRADAREEMDKFEGSGVEYRIRKYVREDHSMNGLD